VKSTIRKKLLLPFALFLAPIAFLLFFLVETHQKGLSTARNEISGLPAVSAALDVSKALFLAVESRDPNGHLILSQTLETFRKELKLWDQYPIIKPQVAITLKSLEDVLANRLISIVDIRDPLDHITQTVRLISDASELILDPELDTYYLMDMLVNQTPELLNILQDMRQDKALSEAQNKTSLDFNGRLSAHLQAVQALSNRLRSTTQNVVRNVRGGHLHEGVVQKSAAYAAALDGLQAYLTNPLTSTEWFSTLEIVLQRETEWQTTVEWELKRLLELRIEQFSTTRNLQVGIAFLLFAFAAAISIFLTIHYVTNPLQQLTHSMQKLAKGALDTEIQSETRQDEVGLMANAVAVFKENAVRNRILEVEKHDAATALALTATTLERAEIIAELGHWRFDYTTKIMNWSPNLFAISGLNSAVGLPSLRSVMVRIPKTERLGFVRYLRSVLKDQCIGDFSCSYIHPEFGLRHMQALVAIERKDEGSASAVMGIIQDVTYTKLNELNLQARTEALAEAQEIGRIGDWSYRFGATHLIWSPEIFKLMNLDPHRFETTREAVMQLYEDDGAKRLLEAQAEVVRTGEMRSIDVRGRLGDGSYNDFTVTSKADLNENGDVIGFSGTIQDISQRKQSERELEKLAYYDPLTGLANRALFQRALRRSLERCDHQNEKAALLLLDLDKFKEVNDSLGHAAGDELLVKTAERLKRELPQDAFLARLGGDEFAVILSNTDSNQAKVAAEMIVKCLGEPTTLRLGEVQIGTSIGIALIPQDGPKQETLLRHADLALYSAKDSGRSCSRFFTTDLSEVVQEKTALARDLRRALASDDQLYVVYQPQIDIQNGCVTGFEALLRWRHPERGNIPPGTFIPVAESSSLIADLGLFVLHASCVQMKAWIDAGHPPRDVAVNVSASQIWQSDFEHDVKQILTVTELPPSLLTLEVTESVFIREAEGRVRQALDALKALGVKLALDDFGTGYSSLGYLNRLPFDKLKIDRRFIAGVHLKPERLKLLKGIIELGRGLGMTTVGEGAEMMEEVRVLKDLNCHIVQGYVFSYPLEGDSAVRAAALLDMMVPARVMSQETKAA
jgi:diguanylate cyclase (GGDEF)-like protein